MRDETATQAAILSALVVLEPQQFTEHDVRLDLHEMRWSRVQAALFRAGKERRMKAKFRVGQVVVVRDNWMHQRHTFRVSGVRPGKDAPEYWDQHGNTYSEVALRKLTRKECGPGRSDE